MNNVEALRKEKGWTVTELAKRAGVSRMTVNELIHNPQYKPSAETMLKVATAFDKTPADVFPGNTLVRSIAAGYGKDDLDQLIKRLAAEMASLRDEIRRSGDEILTIKEMAAVAKVGVKQMYRIAARPDFPRVEGCEGGIRVRKSVLLDYLSPPRKYA